MENYANCEIGGMSNFRRQWTRQQDANCRIAESSGNIWNLLWLSRRLIICNEQTNIKNNFPSTLTSQMAKNREISIYFSTNAIVAFCHAPP